MFVGCNCKCRYFLDFKGFNFVLFVKRENMRENNWFRILIYLNLRRILLVDWFIKLL